MEEPKKVQGPNGRTRLPTERNRNVEEFSEQISRMLTLPADTIKAIVLLDAGYRPKVVATSMVRNPDGTLRMDPYHRGPDQRVLMQTVEYEIGFESSP